MKNLNGQFYFLESGATVFGQELFRHTREILRDKLAQPVPGAMQDQDEVSCIHFFCC